MPLGSGSAEDARVLSLEGLEPTHHAPADAGFEALAELEPTGHAQVAAAGGALPDLEATRAAPVDVRVERALDLEPTGEGIPGDLPTALPVAVTCRYCRTPAAGAGRICARCGMALPLLGRGSVDGAPAARLCSCGSPLRGDHCTSCGARSG
jgi:hypothetical protein